MDSYHGILAEYDVTKLEIYILIAGVNHIYFVRFVIAGRKSEGG